MILYFTPMIMEIARRAMNGDDSAYPVLHDALIELGVNSVWVSNALKSPRNKVAFLSAREICRMIWLGFWIGFEMNEDDGRFMLDWVNIHKDKKGTYYDHSAEPFEG